MKHRMQPHIMCGVGDVGRYILLPGDPNRVKLISSYFDEAEKVADYRGFVTYTGRVDGIEVSACSTGIGCPSAAIVVEELANIGAKTFIRVGTTGSLQPHIDIGDIVIATAAVRSDGTSRTFVPIEYPAVADLEVVSALLKASKKIDSKVYHGVVMSTDAFYGGNEEAILQFGKANVLSIEMECSVIFTLTRLKGLRSGGIMAVDGNIVKGTGKSEFEPGEKSGELDERVRKAINEEIRVAVEAIKILENG